MKMPPPSVPKSLISDRHFNSDLLVVRHNLGDRGAILEQQEGDVLVTGAIDTVGEIARRFRNSDRYPFRKIKLSDFSEAGKNRTGEKQGKNRTDGLTTTSLIMGLPRPSSSGSCIYSVRVVTVL